MPDPPTRFGLFLQLLISLSTIVTQCRAITADEAAQVEPQKQLNLAEVKEGISGRIVVFGEAPTSQPRKNMFLGMADASNESFIVSKDGGLANVFIYLRRAPKDTEVPQFDKAKTLKLNRSGFSPHAMILQTGQKLSVVNNENQQQKVRLKGLMNNWKLWLPAQQAPNGTAEVLINGAERLPRVLRDEFNPQKCAYLLILDHPFAAITDRNGAFSIQGLPPGPYLLVVWHEKIGYLEKHLFVDLQQTEAVQLLLSYPTEKFFRDQDVENPSGPTTVKTLPSVP